MAADTERFGWRHALLGVAAATIGTTIEWYDFFLYGMAASLVFNRIFFPTENPYTGNRVMAVPSLWRLGADQRLFDDFGRRQHNRNPDAQRAGRHDERGPLRTLGRHQSDLAGLIATRPADSYRGEA